MIDAERVTTPLKIRCVSPFAGGKRRLAKRIVELLGPHDTYVEPMVGGCSILPVKPRAEEEVVNDANPAVANVLDVMGLYPNRLIAALEKVPFDRSAFDFARGYIASSSQFDRVGYDAGQAAQQLVVWWQGPGGIAGTRTKPWFAERHSKTGGCPKRRWESFKESLPALCERLKGVYVQNSKWWTLFTEYRPDTPTTAYYVDPPYFAKSFNYSVDFGDGEHEDLAERLNELTRARVVVSYTDDPGNAGRLATLYPARRWRRIEVAQSKNMSAASGKTGRTVELLLVNDVGRY